MIKPSTSFSSSATSKSSRTATTSDCSRRDLLFGEIDNSGPPSVLSNNTICNLILSSNSSLLRFWLIDGVRDSFLSYLDKEDLIALRLVCHDFSAKVAERLFEQVQITFKQSTFTRPARIAALQRVGRHVKTLSFNAPHTPDTFLPPLIHPVTGEELSFMYTPQADILPTPIDKMKHAKYGSFETADLLVKQYPPLFHASTNVPSFIKAMNAMPNVQHLKVSCSSKEGMEVNHHSTVDYALISLRIAVERAPLDHLSSISYLPIHAAGLLYMQPLLGCNAPPGSMRRWTQIRKMNIQMQAVDGNLAARTDKLRMLQTYLRNFAGTLTDFQFRWEGSKGPSPISLDTEPDYHYKDGDMADERQQPGFKALKFTVLNYMELHNAIMDATQISAFICQHRKTLEEFKFESIKLRTGDWDEALSPLSMISGNDEWKRKRIESMEVPLMLSPTGLSEQLIQQMARPVEKGARRSRLGSWLSQHRPTKGTSEQLKKILRASVCPWRTM
ncbi:MAG: hypothetical protein M1828_002705 [Chrysothrix sp. TS-e1954]|nr:MAG: hypothetical protein M1828_002705 [Chrysothrix sp. TS-e1954]